MKTQETKHTPTPWKTKYLSGYWWQLFNDTTAIGEVMHGENAEFIVRAVNSHEALLTLAKTYRQHLKEIGGHTEGIDQTIARVEGRGS